MILLIGEHWTNTVATIISVVCPGLACFLLQGNTLVKTPRVGFISFTSWIGTSCPSIPGMHHYATHFTNDRFFVGLLWVLSYFISLWPVYEREFSLTDKTISHPHKSNQ